MKSARKSSACQKRTFSGPWSFPRENFLSFSNWTEWKEIKCWSVVQIIRARVQQWQGKEREQQGALSRYEEITLEKTEELKEKEKACEEQFKKEALELQEIRRKLEEEKVRMEAQKEYDSLEKEARQLEEQQGEMILAEDRIGQGSGRPRKQRGFGKIFRIFFRDNRP